MLARYKIIFNILICFILIPITAISQGVRFNSSSDLISNRTSYNVFSNNQPKFGSEFSISFELSFNNPLSFGYVFSIKDKENSSVYSMAFVNGAAGSGQLKLNLDTKRNIFSIPLRKNQLGTKKWIKIKVFFSSLTKKIVITINGKNYTKDNSYFLNTIEPEIYFGKHESVIEVPYMSLRNLVIGDINKKYEFKFNENIGQDVHDLTGKKYGRIENAKWLIEESYHWRRRKSYSYKGEASVTFDNKNQKFIVINSETLAFFSIDTDKNVVYKLKNKNPIPMRLGNSILDTLSNNLYVYELNDVSNNLPTIASINLTDFSWKENSRLQLEMQRHHHNATFDYKNHGFYIFGGFGNQKYTNDFNFYDISINKWIQIPFKGDVITPRFFSGCSTYGSNEILLFGGIGNESGDQTIGRQYYYDCYKVNLKTKTIKKLWDLNNRDVKMVSARNMVLSNDRLSFYTLCYPEYIANTSLQLYKYSIKNGGHEILGDSIPMNSERIFTNANLYYSSATNELYCTTQEYKLDGSNKITIYSLNQPPISRELINSNLKNYNFNYIILAIFITLLILISIILFRKRNKVKNQILVQKVLNYSLIKPETIKRPNSIFLFGNFTVINSKGRDISYLFSPKIKQLFLLLLYNSNKENSSGITSELIYSVIWHDSSTEKAKNLKNVTINQLRKILEEVEGIEVVYSERLFMLEFNEGFHCDYFDFSEQLVLFKKDYKDEESLMNLINITRNGPFLKSLEDEYFDKFKNEFEFELMKVIPNQLKIFYKNKNYPSIIPMTEILFYIDSLNEMAFYYRIHAFLKMGLINDAKKSFNNFVVDYKKILNDDFSKTFLEVSKKIPKGLF